MLPPSPVNLVPPTPALAEQVLGWRNDPEVLRWFLTQQVDAAELREWFTTYDGKDGHLVVATIEDVAVGSASVRVSDGMGQSGHETEFVAREGWIAYTVDPAYAGRGVGTLLAEDALSNAFGRLGLRRVQAGCFADNVASWRVMEKLGMRREQHGIRDSFHAELGWVDGYTYAILAEEWASRGEV
ncbi:GNAT family N-acetyltransferase [Nocardioides coralli]|uniref:GNAT family N-acetyltransferase n=1 Tax=Nocardioides coralli TaxID=2872154 RepID=UPI001CA3EFA0|nr:GNAT family protein [Nocardioides coralli]QZY30597.1 GNAT family N-acetyltransferase [Nocardioides coralli]